MELQREYLRGARRRAQRARDYFDEDEGEEERAAGPKDDDGDVDPLDAFMLGIDAQVVREQAEVRAPVEKVKDGRNFWRWNFVLLIDFFVVD